MAWLYARLSQRARGGRLVLSADLKNFFITLLRAAHWGGGGGAEGGHAVALNAYIMCVPLGWNGL
jgi:hypothetical protein